MIAPPLPDDKWMQGFAGNNAVSTVVRDRRRSFDEMTIPLWGLQGLQADASICRESISR